MKIMLYIMLASLIFLTACQSAPEYQNDLSLETHQEVLTTSNGLDNIPERLDVVLENEKLNLRITADILSFGISNLYEIEISPMPTNIDAALNALFSPEEIKELILMNGQYRLLPDDSSDDALMAAGLIWEDGSGFFDFSDYRTNTDNAIMLDKMPSGNHITLHEAVESGHELLSKLGLDGAYFYSSSSFHAQSGNGIVYHSIEFVPIYAGLPIIFDNVDTIQRPSGHMVIGDDGILSINGNFLFHQTKIAEISTPLSFDEILENVRLQLTNQNPLAPVPVTRINLCYYPSSPDGNNYYMATPNSSSSTSSQATNYILRPAWCFYMDTQDSAYTNELKSIGYRAGTICVDAITGNIIAWP